MARNVELTFEKQKTLCTLSDKDGYTKEVAIVSWNNQPAKVDIRNWKPDGMPGKGITLTEDEARTLFKALAERYKSK